MLVLVDGELSFLENQTSVRVAHIQNTIIRDFHNLSLTFNLVHF